MRFSISRQTENILVLMRRLGYYPQRKDKVSGQISFVRPLTSGAHYPRFHVYLAENKDKLNFSLHLDQKQQSYRGTAKHGGEYKGGLLTQEAERIKQVDMH